MGKRALPPPTDEERQLARSAAAALRTAIADVSTAGERSSFHVDLARPRRGEWWTTWANLPGFTRIRSGQGARYTHALLPGWEYAQNEVRREMIPDLEFLAERGVRPMEATR